MIIHVDFQKDEKILVHSKMKNKSFHLSPLELHTNSPIKLGASSVTKKLLGVFVLCVYQQGLEFIEGNSVTADGKYIRVFFNQTPFEDLYVVEADVLKHQIDMFLSLRTLKCS